MSKHLFRVKLSFQRNHAPLLLVFLILGTVATFTWNQWDAIDVTPSHVRKNSNSTPVNETPNDVSGGSMGDHDFSPKLPQLESLKGEKYTFQKVDGNRLPNFVNPEAIGFLQEHFPECVLPPSQNAMIDLKTMGSYVASDYFGSPPPQPKYDHVSCFVMKSRYNCAYPSTTNSTTTTFASDYELVLNLSPDSKPCRLRQIFDEAQDVHMPWLNPVVNSGESVQNNLLGPAGLRADRLGRYHILLHGNSFMRQIWESITCTFRNHITDFQVCYDYTPKQLNGEKASVEISELGDVIRNKTLVQERGCHTHCTQERGFYRPGVPKPPCWTNCDDDIAMVELNGIWRFYFVFRVIVYSPKTAQYIYDEMFRLSQPSSNPTIGAVMVWNSAWGRDTLNVIPAYTPPKKSNNTGQRRHVKLVPKRVISADHWLKTLFELQDRDLHQHFFARNPGVDVPDAHACMPGVPDDEANLLLFSLLTGYNVQN